MTFYVILKWQPKSNSADSGYEWYPITDPEHYLDAKKKMREMKSKNPKDKFRLIKTSY